MVVDSGALSDFDEPTSYAGAASAPPQAARH